MSTLRLGVLGAGAMGARIADGALRSGRFEITAVIDQDAERANALADRVGGTVFTDLHDPGLANVDALYVGTPNTVRVEVCRRAAEADWHLLIDKPLCTTEAEAETIAGLVDGSGLTWMVGFSYRFRGEWRRARDLIADGVLGTPLLVTDVIVESARNTPSWYWEAASGGGVLQLQSHHCFDRIRWLFDSPFAELPASLSRGQAEVDHAASVAGRLDNGAAMSIALGFATGYDGDPRALFVAQGTAGMVQIDQSRTLSVTDSSGTKRTSYADDDWLCTELSDFAAAITGELTDYPNVSDGWRALGAALRAAASAGHGAS